MAAAQADGPAWARFRHAGDQTAPVRWPVISQGTAIQNLG